MATYPAKVTAGREDDPALVMISTWARVYPDLMPPARGRQDGRSQAISLSEFQLWSRNLSFVEHCSPRFCGLRTGFEGYCLGVSEAQWIVEDKGRISLPSKSQREAKYLS